MDDKQRFELVEKELDRAIAEGVSRLSEKNPSFLLYAYGNTYDALLDAGLMIEDKPKDQVARGGLAKGYEVLEDTNFQGFDKYEFELEPLYRAI